MREPVRRRRRREQQRRHGVITTLPSRRVESEIEIRSRYARAGTHAVGGDAEPSRPRKRAIATKNDQPPFLGATNERIQVSESAVTIRRSTQSRRGVAREPPFSLGERLP